VKPEGSPGFNKGAIAVQLSPELIYVKSKFKPKFCMYLSKTDDCYY
jgi:hypothetical protein